MKPLACLIAETGISNSLCDSFATNLQMWVLLYPYVLVHKSLRNEKYSLISTWWVNVSRSGENLTSRKWRKNQWNLIAASGHRFSLVSEWIIQKKWQQNPSSIGCHYVAFLARLLFLIAIGAHLARYIEWPAGNKISAETAHRVSGSKLFWSAIWN